MGVEGREFCLHQYVDFSPFTPIFLPVLRKIYGNSGAPASSAGSLFLL